MAWTSDEVARAVALFNAGKLHREIAVELGRSRQAVGYLLNALGLQRRASRRGDTEARFWSFVPDRPVGDCWMWRGPVFSYGYGMFSVWPKVVGAHRFAFELEHGVIPAGLVVMHSCDEPLCVNPKHLRAGTVQENEDDKRMKGRQARGERHGMARYSAEQVEAVRAMLRDGATRADAAAATGVKLTTVHTIASGKQWRR